jgi:uncharacterized membrane protein YGL010W
MTNVLERYEDAHQHPLNRRLHAIGIPLIAVSALGAISPWRPFGWRRSTFVAGMAAGWGLLFAGHYIEGNRPVVFSNPTVLITAPGWWARRTIRVCLRRPDPARSYAATPMPSI